MIKKRLFIDLDGVLCDFMGPFRESRRINPEFKYPQSKIGYFRGLKPMKDAIESFNELKKHFDVWILTRPSFNNIHCFTEKAEWVLEYLGYDVLEKLIISGDKSLVKGDYLIDDHGGNGQSEFEGEWIHFGQTPFENWEKVTKYMIEKKDSLN